MKTMHEKHMEFVDLVNEAKTEDEHYGREMALRGWRLGVEDAGFHLDLCEADLEQFARGFGHRPMCCGVFLDWQAA